jgi:hypothetical protein
MIIKLQTIRKIAQRGIRRLALILMIPLIPIFIGLGKWVCANYTTKDWFDAWLQSWQSA